MARARTVLAGACVLGVLAVGVAAWLLRDGGPGETAPGPGGSAASAPASARTDAAAAAPTAAPEARPPAGPASPGSITGRLVRGFPPSPVPGQIVVTGRGAAARSAPAGADGRFAVDGLPRDTPVDLSATSEGLLPARYFGLWIDARGPLDLGDVLLGAAQRLEVQVRDRGDRPVPNAAVSLVRASVWTATSDWVSRELRPAATRTPEASLRTDAKGIAVFAATPPGNWVVLTEAEGFARANSAANLVEGEAREPVRVVLSPACTLEGTVFGVEGKPLPGVTVRATASSGYWPQEFARVESPTDEKGGYRVAGLAEGTVALAVLTDADTQVGAGSVQVPGVKRYDIRLGRGFAVRGKVLDDATGKPVEGARVTVQIWNQQVPGGGGLARRASAADGTFEFASLPVGNFGNVQVRKDGYLDWPDSLAPTLTYVPVVAGVVEEREARLHRGAAVRGRVLDVAAKPVAGARVQLYVFSPASGAQQSPSAISGADGAWRIENVGPGRALVQAQATGWLQPKFPADYWSALSQGNLPEECAVDVPREGEAVKDVILSAGGVVEGVITRADGAPAVGIRPYITSNTGRGGGGISAPADAEGRFRAVTVSPGDDLVARVAGPKGERGASEPFRLGEGETVKDIRVSLKAGGGIAGRVRREDGRSAQGATLRVMEGGGDPRQPREMPWSYRNATGYPVGADGEFRIEGLAAGKCTLICQAEGTAPATVAGIEIPEGSVKEGVDVVLPVEKTISGTVVNDRRDPVPGARVYLRGEVMMERRSFGPGNEDPVAGIADAEGKFLFPGLGDGNYTVSADAPGLVKRSLKAKGGATDLVLVLSAGAVISGIVVEEADGSPVADVPITVSPAVAAMGNWNGVQGRSLKDGTFVVEGLDPEAEFNVVAGQQWGQGKTEHAPKTVQKVKAGTTDLRIALARGLAIAGTLLDEQGAPLTVRLLLQATCWGADGNPDWSKQRSGQSEPNGTFRLTGLEPGVYDLTVGSAGWGGGGSPYAMTTLRSVAAGSEGLTITLRRGQTISGRILDDKGDPVRGAGWMTVSVSGDPPNSPGNTGVQIQMDGTFTTVPLDSSKSYDLTVGPMAGTMGGSLRGVAPGAKDVVLRLSRGGTVSGRVLNETGQPAGRGVQVFLRADGVPNEQLNQPGAQAGAVTKEDGTFSVAGLGDFRFKVTAGGGGSDFQPSTLPGTVAPGATDVEVRVKPGVAIAGRLVNPAGDGVQAQSLMGMPEGVEGAIQSWAAVGPDGTFTMKGLPPGKVRIRAYVSNRMADCGVFEAPATGLNVTVPEK
jgi:uncharacterized GH25 family protein